MITFFTALYPEAKGLITAYKLKQNPTETFYQLFEGDDVRLVITGAGMIAAATAAARHFANYPSESSCDLVINLGVAGFLKEQQNLSLQTLSFPPTANGFSSSGCNAVGDLFFVSKITELATGRTFYPDLLFKHEFRQLPLLTSPVVLSYPAAKGIGFQSLEQYSKESSFLIDMEASALFQALLPHFSPERMLFFKVVSDILPDKASTSIKPEELIAPHLEAVLSYVLTLYRFLQSQAPREIFFTEEEKQLISKVQLRLPLTNTMQNELERLLTYAALSRSPLKDCLEQFLASLPEVIRGKKQAMPYLEQLRELILNIIPEIPDSTAAATTAAGIPHSSSQYTSHSCSAAANLYQPFFSTVYIEKEIWNPSWQDKLSTPPIFIDHYKDIFNRSHQNFALQKKAPALILAKKTGTLIYKGAPVCQSFGNEHFYYTSCMMNCIYHCDYCYLQGMYPSGHVVVFVNLEDYFNELEALLKEHPVYLCVSYDTDLLALEQTFSFVSSWLAFAAGHPTLTLEIRTKSGNPAIFETLAKLYTGKAPLMQQIIFAWTVSPEALCKTTEHGAASLPLRLKALLAAKQAGFSVRLCFDPMIFHAGWKEQYSALVATVFSTISADCLYDASIGVFRISTDYLKNMRKKRPDCALVQYPYITENGVSHYGTLSEEMVHYLQELLSEYMPPEKVFIWNGE